MWDEVFVYSEDKKEWLGPFIAVDSTGGMITVYKPETKLRQNVNAFQIKPYYIGINHNISRLRSKSGPGPPRFNDDVTEAIQTHDPRANKFDKAMKKKLKD